MKGKSLLLRSLVYLCAGVTIGILSVILLFILVKGIPHIRLDFLFANYTPENLSLLSPLMTTLEMIALSLLFSLPVGLGAAIYWTEYAKPGSRWVGALSFAVEILAAIPSIVYGLFGMIAFVSVLGTSVLAGALTVSLMILPTIIKTAQEAIKSVPRLYKEGSLALGASKLFTLQKVVLPTALHGILSGVILSIGRVVGESAPLIFTSGTHIGDVTFDLLASRRTLSIHMYMLASEGLPHSRDTAFATGAVLILIVLLINTLAAHFAKKLGGGNHG